MNTRWKRRVSRIDGPEGGPGVRVAAAAAFVGGNGELMIIALGDWPARRPGCRRHRALRSRNVKHIILYTSPRPGNLFIFPRTAARTRVCISRIITYVCVYNYVYIYIHI